MILALTIASVDKFIQPVRHPDLPEIAKKLQYRFKDGPPVQIIETAGNGGQSVKIIFLLNQNAKSSYLPGVAVGDFDESYFRQRLVENVLYVHNTDNKTSEILLKLKKEYPTRIIYRDALLE